MHPPPWSSPARNRVHVNCKPSNLCSSTSLRGEKGRPQPSSLPRDLKGESSGRHQGQSPLGPKDQCSGCRGFPGGNDIANLFRSPAAGSLPHDVISIERSELWVTSAWKGGTLRLEGQAGPRRGSQGKKCQLGAGPALGLRKDRGRGRIETDLLRFLQMPDQVTSQERK